jgi:hypothetical protein
MPTISTREATWDCACLNEHRPTIARAWCFACSEWCYPHDLCVRGRLAEAEAKLEARDG